MSPAIRRTVFNAALTVLVIGLSGQVLGVPNLHNALAVPLGILFGIPGVIGFALGSLFHNIVTPGPGLGVIALLIGDIAVAASGYVLWGERQVPAVSETHRELLTGAARYLLVGGVALLIGVGVQATGLMLGGRAPFAVALVLALSERAIPILLIGPFVIVALATVGYREAASSRTDAVTMRQLAGSCLVLGLWVGTGFLLSAVRQDLVARPGFTRETVLSALPQLLEPLVLFSVGPGYNAMQLSTAGLSVFVVAVLVLGDRRPAT